MKKQWVVALALLLCIPVVMVVGGGLSNLINPEIAAGHPNYARNYHLLHLLKLSCFFGAVAISAVLWLVVCFLVIRSKKRSWLWLCMAALGPCGLAVLVMLNDRASSETDRYARFVRGMNRWVRVGYEVACFVMVWVLAYQAMVLNRELIIRYQAVTTGVSTQQIVDIQNASGGMWAFAEGNEVMFLVALFYLLRPIVFAVVSHLASTIAASRAH